MGGLVDGLGLVLAGGASRGAYEAGVLRFIYTDLARRLGHAPWPSVVCGTSVGALNGAFVVARDAEGLGWLCRKWGTITIPEVFGMSYADLYRTVVDALRGRPFALADPTPMQKLVARNWPGRAIRRSITELGVTWMVGATDLANGNQVVFVDSAGPPAWPHRPGVRYEPTRIKPIHALASGALPLLFPPIPLGGKLYVDGGLRQNTPLSPVLRAGARRVLVVSLKRVAQDEARLPQPPNLVFLLGKLMNALLLDPVEVDLHDAEQLNELIRWGRSKFGPAFAEAIDADLGLRETEILFHTPSQDLGALAAEIYRRTPPAVNGLSGQLLERAAAQAGPDADLLSYIYFDHQYTGAIEQLGYEDARRNEERIARLVAPAG